MFSKWKSKLTNTQFDNIKNVLLDAKWYLQDTVSPHVSKQVNSTIESILGNETSFMGQTRTKGIPKCTKTLRAGYTLAFCNPLSNLRELGTDGFDNYHAPILDGKYEPFLRRMWVSGKLEFSENKLKIGEAIQFTETVSNVKNIPRLNLIVCDYLRSFENIHGISVKETRRLCYLNSLHRKQEGKVIDSKDIPDSFTWVRPSLIDSFRVSALCFNAHLIHYDSNYAMKVEGYPQVVVEAPMLVLLSLQYWGNLNLESIQLFDYKISSPVFVNDKIRICYTKVDGKSWKVWIDHGVGTSLCLNATLNAY